MTKYSFMLKADAHANGAIYVDSGESVDSTNLHLYTIVRIDEDGLVVLWEGDDAPAVAHLLIELNNKD